jgi:arylsulfatase A-like enzyme
MDCVKIVDITQLYKYIVHKPKEVSRCNVYIYKISRGGQVIFKTILEFVSRMIFFFCLAGSANADSPNVVLILADDLGFTDTQPYGSEISTPNIARLANEGLMFTNYHTAATCSPTRGMLLTGVDSHRNGVPNIPETTPSFHKKFANYTDALNQNVVTIATLLKDAGYHTYMAGKWHLGKKLHQLPSQRGFERTLALMESGADNWEQKTFAPMYSKANWFADGKEATLPEDFYSSKHFVDKSIEFIESNRKDGKPFFSYIPFQAVHIPIQAPKEFSDKYLGTYDEGWQKLRQQRLEMAKKLKLVPEDTRIQNLSTTKDWDALSSEEKRFQSKQMAVYAGMVDAMDFHIGRFIRYLKEHDLYDNTVFVFTSDNGPEPSDVFGRSKWENEYMKVWLKMNGSSLDYDTLGTRGSWGYIGPSFASAAASPLAYYKFFSGEGGIRVPMIISGSPVTQKGKISNTFTFVTDIAPTILEITGVSPAPENYQGRKIEPIVGKSLMPLLKGETERAHAIDETIGYELGGNAALFQGDFKIVKDRGPVGDNIWHLFNILKDPGETKDLKEEMPERFETMMTAYAKYEKDNDVQPVPDGYDQQEEITRYALRNRFGDNYPFYIAGISILVLGLSGFFVWHRIRKRKIGAANDH